jgi:mannosylglycerate hydrolase MGH1-like protein
MKCPATAVLIVCLAACLSGIADDMHSIAHQAPQYQAIRHRLLHGWGTWDSQNLLEEVHLPDGAAVSISFKETNWLSCDYLRSALIGRPDPGAEVVRPGLRALDGSYVEYELKWQELDVKVSSAAVGQGGDDMVTLIEPEHPSVLPHEVFVAAKILWNRPGAVSRMGDLLAIDAGGRLLHVYATEQPIRDPYARTDAPYLALQLGRAAGISVGRRRTLAEIRAVLARRRAALLTRAAQFGDSADTSDGIEAVLGWNTIYEPKYDRMITTVGRIWNEEYGGYCLFGWDNFFLAYMTSLYSEDLGDANYIEHLRSMTYDGFIPNDDRGNGTKSWDHSQPPVGSLMLREIYKRQRQKWLLQTAFPDLLHWNEWWFHARMNNGLLSYGSNLAKNPYGAPTPTQRSLRVTNAAWTIRRCTRECRLIR